MSFHLIDPRMFNIYSMTDMLPMVMHWSLGSLWESKVILWLNNPRVLKTGSFEVSHHSIIHPIYKFIDDRWSTFRKGGIRCHDRRSHFALSCSSVGDKLCDIVIIRDTCGPTIHQRLQITSIAIRTSLCIEEPRNVQTYPPCKTSWPAKYYYRPLMNFHRPASFCQRHISISAGCIHIAKIHWNHTNLMNFTFKSKHNTTKWNKNNPGHCACNYVIVSYCIHQGFGVLKQHLWDPGPLHVSCARSSGRCE